MKVALGFLPESRLRGLISRQADGELLIYDLERDKAHCLNESAAAIWKACDGTQSVKDISEALRAKFGDGFDETVVGLAVADLHRLHLLERPLGDADNNQYEFTRPASTLSRREVVRRLGLSAAVLLPVVISITAPTPAQAGSCLAVNSPCSTTAECCGGLICLGNVCTT